MNSLISQRATLTEESVVKIAMQYWAPGVLTMSQGMAYWTPPEEALSLIPTLVADPMIHRYGPIDGGVDLQSALKQKVEKVNHLSTDRSIYVTSGCNQAFFELLIALCDPSDEVIVLVPYYFNHMMAMQLLNVSPVIVDIGQSEPTHPDTKLKYKQSILESDKDEDVKLILGKISEKITKKTKAIDIINPGNPFGAVPSKRLLIELQKLCQSHNIWLISDETYEDFVFDGKEHISPQGNNVINLYSFSKCFGLAGWRVGYMSYPSTLRDALDKIQDCNPITTCQLSQKLALTCLQKCGQDWVAKKVHTLQANREEVWNAISDFPGAIRTSGALYFMVMVPMTGTEATAYLAKEWKVLVIPCEGCGVSNYIRISYGSLQLEQCKEAAAKLRQGLLALWKR